MNVAQKPETVYFSIKGQVVIPRRVRKEFGIEEGTRAIISVTDDGILLKPVTAALIKRGRGILKRKPGDKSLTAEWTGHRQQEKDLEDRLAR